MILADFQLPRRLRPVMARLARVLLPADQIERFALDEQLVDTVELQLRAFPAGFRLGMVAGLATLEGAAALRFGRPFSRLDEARAAAWVASWWSSPIGPFRALVRAMKSLLALAFYDSAPMRDRVAYHPDAWIARVAARRLESFGLDIQRHEEELLAPDPLVSLRKVRHA
jgi:transposase